MKFSFSLLVAEISNTLLIAVYFYCSKNLSSSLHAYLYCSTNANRYMMRELARLGSGVSEYFNPKAKSKWSKQVIFEVVKKHHAAIIVHSN